MFLLTRIGEAMPPFAELPPGNLDGRRQFAQERRSWQYLTDAIAQSLIATPQEI